MDAYVFVKSATAEGMERLHALTKDSDSGVRFATGLTGEHDALLAIKGKDLATLERTVMTKVRGHGISGTETAVAMIILPQPMPKLAPPMSTEAFVRCRVAPGKAQEVSEALMRLPGAMGVAIVAASFDVLFEAGADSLEDLQEILGQLHAVSGLVWTSSGLATFEV